MRPNFFTTKEVTSCLLKRLSLLCTKYWSGFPSNAEKTGTKQFESMSNEKLTRIRTQKPLGFLNMLGKVKYTYFIYTLYFAILDFLYCTMTSLMFDCKNNKKPFLLI